MMFLGVEDKIIIRRLQKVLTCIYGIRYKKIKSADVKRKLDNHWLGGQVFPEKNQLIQENHHEKRTKQRQCMAGPRR